ncbi:TetR/AcrR family transcriptional regulator [Micromonospora eburnea]|uniref:Transcriptional regulator, TetR family n=1 Tax=Micromonospora eburnea TaxID=227316 RepID=A0A1C6TZG5_9ACTN|nr:TetR/AcrR family transcriptional regulator [Micromonospora eburnea]SCL47157.1 transcriptional regulator, TetR family [Micromonospora eburnea]
MDGTTDAVGTRGKRADAQRNIAAILDAALECLVRNPDANIAEIARRAGVGRVTLYGHFSSREDLIGQLFTRTLDRADRALDSVDLTGDPRAALSRLVASSWQIVDQFRHLLDAAQRSLPPARIRAAHEGPMRRIAGLIERGQAEGVFRTDLPATWMVALVHTVVHAAADEIADGRLAEQDAARVIDATLQAAYTPPAG